MYTAFGLALEFIAAFILLSGEFKTSGALLRRDYKDKKETGTSLKSWLRNTGPPWWWPLKIFPLLLAAKLGSNDALNTEETTSESFLGRFWGFLLLAVGFLLQLYGAFIN